LSIDVKICGLSDADSVAAAVEGGARFLGFVFYQKSRHHIDPASAAALISKVPSTVATVGLFVDPSDDELKSVLDVVPLKLIQLHGSEAPERVSEVRKNVGLPVIKAVGIGIQQDVAAAKIYEPVADYLLLDAKLPSGVPSGGKGVVFDWSLLGNASFSKPWFLAGGLNADNIEKAVKMSHAPLLDVSSGVEDVHRQKSPALIRDFLDKVRAIETCC